MNRRHPRWGAMLSVAVVITACQEQLPARPPELQSSAPKSTSGRARSQDSDVDGTGSGWQVGRIAGGIDGYSVVHFTNGREFRTRLYDARYLGQLPARHKPPYLILSGVGCTDCDANTSVYFHSPGDGPMPPEPDQARYSYPGVVTDMETGEPLERSRLFLGECLADREPVAVWFTDVPIGAGVWESSALVVRVVEDALHEERDEGGTRLESVRQQTARGRCREVEGVERAEEP